MVAVFAGCTGLGCTAFIVASPAEWRESHKALGLPPFFDLDGKVAAGLSSMFKGLKNFGFAGDRPMDREQLTFGPFRFDLSRRQLLRDGQPVQLGGRALDILCELAAAKGDVVSKDELLARLWPGRIVEEGNIHVHVSALRKALEVHGEQYSYIVTVPGRGYRLGGFGSANITDAKDFPRNSPPDKPSIAVLPFQNMSGDPGQDYFADGVTEEIITALSRIPSFFVVARHSTFAYKGQALDIREVGRDLGARYALEGSVRRANDRVRITAQLVDTATGVHLWADRFDRPMIDIFDVQDQITASIIGAIEPKLRETEIERARRKPADNLQAYDLLLRSRFTFPQQTRDALEETCRLLQHAIELDPNYALALAWLARTQYNIDLNHFRFPSAAEVDRYVRLAQRAVVLGPDEPEVLVVASAVIGMPGGDLTEAIALVDRALTFNPNSAEAWAMSGMLYANMGDGETALHQLDRSVQLCPTNLWVNWHNTAFILAHFAAEQYENALVWTERELRRRNPDHIISLRWKAAILGLLGRTDEAQQVVQHLCALVPGLTISRFRNVWAVVRKQSIRWPAVDAARLEGLRRAGLPE